MVTLEQVRSRREEILALAAESKVGNVRVIGSVARGDQRPDSDLDLLVACEPECSLWDLTGFEGHLKDLLGVRVEVATEGAQKPRVQASIERDAVPL